MSITKEHLETARTRLGASVDTQFKALIALLDGEPPPPDPDEGERALRSAVIASNADRRIAKWDVTADLEFVTVTPGRIVFPYTVSGEPWPIWKGSDPDKPVVGNIWFGAKLDGQWHFGTVDWLRPHQKDKTLDVPEKHIDTAHALPTFIKAGPLGSYVPRMGDECAILVSSIARNGGHTVDQRSNVILPPDGWPY